MHVLLCIVLVSTCMSTTASAGQLDLCKEAYTRGKVDIARTACLDVANYEPYAQYLLGMLSLDANGNPTPVAMKWLLKAAGNGVVEAHRSLGEISLRGAAGAKNYSEAQKWFQAAAEKNDQEAQFQLGMMLIAGRGSGKDLKQGYSWLKIAANGGHSPAEKQASVTKKNMTAAQIAEANDHILSWNAKHPR